VAEDSKTPGMFDVPLEFQGEEIETRLEPSGIFVCTSPVRAVPHPDPPPEPYKPSGLLLATGIPLDRKDTTKKVKFNMRQGMELTRRPDKDGR
jgi:hypothetical protein